MSYSLKCFMQLSASLLNTPNTIAPFGEISNQSLTYSREQKVYINNDPTTMILRAFYTKSSDATVEIPEVIKNKVFEITQWIKQIQYSINAYNTKTAFLSALTNQFGNDITGINCGDLVSNQEGIYFPSWIGYVQLGIANTNFYSDNLIKIWFSDQRFRIEYDENEIVVIPPVSNLETLFSSKTSVETALINFRNNELINQINLAQNNSPATIISNETYLWKDPSNPDNSLNTIWTVVIYGQMDGNSDYIKDAIRNYISDNSTRNENDWRALIPDIYLSTEFYIFPRWLNMAISERELQVGQYSPIVNLKRELNYLKSFMSNLTSTHIETFLAVIPFQFKSVTCLVIPGMENRDNVFNIKDVFPDYLNVPTTELLFELQNTKTKEWVILMGYALVAAETVGTFDSVPLGMRKVFRNNILYVAFKYDNIEYLISTKETTPGYTN